jgi:hypothetical protein
MFSFTTLRRASLGVLTTAAIVATAAATQYAASVQTAAASTPTSSSVEPSSKWLKTLTAKHKQLFDSPAPAGGIGLVHIMNYYDT